MPPVHDNPASLGMDAVLGQDDTVAELRAEKKHARRAHAYLFEGGAGVGRMTLARAWVAELWCENPDRPGCGQCRPCRLLAHDAHPDYLELPRESRSLALARFVEGKTASKTDPVDHPPVLSFLHLRPVEAPFRAVIVPDAERMRAEAANALLKTLEEPPGGAVVLLTTLARDRLPATIVSRCRPIRVRPLPEERIVDELRRRELPSPSPSNDAPPPDDEGVSLDTMRQSIAALAEGSLGFALRFALDPEAPALWTWLGTALTQRGPAGAWALTRGLTDRLPASSGKGKAPQREVAMALLDALALRLRRMAREDGHDPRAAYAALECVAAGAAQIAANVQPALALTATGLGVASALWKNR